MGPFGGHLGCWGASRGPREGFERAPRRPKTSSCAKASRVAGCCHPGPSRGPLGGFLRHCLLRASAGSREGSRTAQQPVTLEGIARDRLSGHRGSFAGPPQGPLGLSSAVYFWLQEGFERSPKRSVDQSRARALCVTCFCWPSWGLLGAPIGGPSGPRRGLLAAAGGPLGGLQEGPTYCHA